MLEDGSGGALASARRCGCRTRGLSRPKRLRWMLAVRVVGREASAGATAARALVRSPASVPKDIFDIPDVAGLRQLYQSDFQMEARLRRPFEYRLRVAGADRSNESDPAPRKLRLGARVLLFFLASQYFVVEAQFHHE